MITKSAVIYLLLCYLAYPTVAQPTRELSFEFSCSEYQKLRKECEKRIDALEKAEHYMHAAIVCRKLLSDFNREREELTRERTHLEQKNPNISHNTWKMNMLARQMATCYAHLGDFAQAKQWLKKQPGHWQRISEEEISKCEKFLPILERGIKDYRLKPSSPALRELIEIYLELDEYAFALAFMNVIMADYPEDDWTQSEDFRGCSAFLQAFRAEPVEEVEEQKPAPAASPKVEALFDKLWALEEEKRELEQRRWNEMDVIEKAKLVNRHMSQIPLRGRDFNPTREEAIEFLRNTINSNVPLSRLTAEEIKIYVQRTDEIISELAALGEEAFDELISMLQDIRSRKGFPHWLQPSWASKALERIGTPAISKLKMAFDKASQPKGQQRRANPANALYIVQTLSKIHDRATIPVLRRALNEADGHTREYALYGLAQFEDGLTTEMLLNLWESETEHYMRSQIAVLLERYGDATAIPVLERDMKTAFASEANRAAHAIWAIKKRMGEPAGEEPERIRGKSKGYMSPPYYQGAEKSLRCPNKAIRIMAIRWLQLRRKNKDMVQKLIDVMRHDEDAEVRNVAAKAVGEILPRVSQREGEEKSDSAWLQGIFNTLMEMAETDDAVVKTQVLYAIPYALIEQVSFFGKFKRFQAILLDGIESEYPDFQAASLLRFVWLLGNYGDTMVDYPPSERRASIISHIVSAVDSDYGRLKIDAISAAGYLKAQRAVPKLIDIAQHDESHHRDNALYSLQQIAAPSALPALYRIAQTDPFVNQWGIYSNRETAWHAIKEMRKGKRLLQ